MKSDEFDTVKRLTDTLYAMIGMAERLGDLETQEIVDANPGLRLILGELEVLRDDLAIYDQVSRETRV